MVAYTTGITVSDKIKSSQKFIHSYLGSANQMKVCFPDHMCGQDIIYKFLNTKTVYIVQVKFVKSITKQETANASDTTDELFYCKRKLEREIM